MNIRKLTLLAIAMILSCVAIYFVRPFFRNYTNHFLKNHASADFNEFRGTSFVVRSMRGKEIHCYASKPSITNGLIWFYIDCDTYEYLTDSPKYTPDESFLTDDEKRILGELKPLFPTFVKYRVCLLTVDEIGNVFVGVEDFGSINLIKPISEDSIPEISRRRIKKKIGDWYLLK